MSCSWCLREGLELQPAAGRDGLATATAVCNDREACDEAFWRRRAKAELAERDWAATEPARAAAAAQRRRVHLAGCDWEPGQGWCCAAGCTGTQDRPTLRGMVFSICGRLLHTDDESYCRACAEEMEPEDSACGRDVHLAGRRAFSDDVDDEGWQEEACDAA